MIRRTVAWRWLTEPRMYLGGGWRGRAWNATRWRLWVSRLLLREWRPPMRFRFAYRHIDLAADTYGLVGLHLLMRAANWWRGARWCLERVALEQGKMKLGEGEFYRDARWAP